MALVGVRRYLHSSLGGVSKLHCDLESTQMRIDPLDKAGNSYWYTTLRLGSLRTPNRALTISPRRIVNALSLSRIGLALLFVICFQRVTTLLYVSIGVCAFALTTD